MAADLGAQNSPRVPEHSKTPVHSSADSVQRPALETSALGSAEVVKKIGMSERTRQLSFSHVITSVSQKQVSQTLALVKSKDDKLSAEVAE